MSTTTEISLHSLFISFQKGDEQAFRHIVLMYQDAIYNLCLGYVHRMQLAEELAQDVFVKLWKSRGDIREAKAVKSWLYQTAINLCLMELRKEKRKKYWYEVQSWLGFESSEELEDESYKTHPALQLERKEQRQAFRRALNKLTEAQQSVIVLHYFEQLEAKEIADMLKMSPGAVEASLHRARNQLKKHLNLWETQ